MDTSYAAYLSINATELEELVYQVILKSKIRGATADEIRRTLPNLAYSSITMRFCFLENKGRIYRPGVTRLGDSGRAQLVMYADKYEQQVSDRLRRVLDL